MDMIELEPALGAAAVTVGGHVGTAAAVTIPDGASHRRGDVSAVPRALGFGRTRLLRTDLSTLVRDEQRAHARLKQLFGRGAGELVPERIAHAGEVGAKL